MQRVGSRAQVMHGNAKMTGGGLKKKDLKYNKQGRIVSKKMSQRAKKEKEVINILTWNMDGNRENYLEFHMDPDEKKQNILNNFIKDCIKKIGDDVDKNLTNENINSASSAERNFKNSRNKKYVKMLHPGENLSLLDNNYSHLDKIDIMIEAFKKFKSNITYCTLIKLYYIFLCCAIYIITENTNTSKEKKVNLNVKGKKLLLKKYRDKIKQVYNKIKLKDKNKLSDMIISIKNISTTNLIKNNRINLLKNNLIQMLEGNKIDFACLQECVDYKNNFNINEKYKIIIKKPGNEWVIPDINSGIIMNHEIKDTCLNYGSTKSTFKNPNIAIIYNSIKYHNPQIKCYAPHVLIKEKGKKNILYESILIIDFKRITDKKIIRVASAHLKSTGDKGCNYCIANQILSTCDFVGMDCNNKGQWEEDDGTDNNKTFGNNKIAIAGLARLKGDIFMTSPSYGKSTCKRRTAFQTQLDKFNKDSSCKDLCMVNVNSMRKIFRKDKCNMTGLTIPKLNDTDMTPSSGIKFSLYPGDPNTDIDRPWDSDHCAVITTF
tara:strand:- start:52 stop:1692 length:1641 start_codon:yes stop_codon:yes gene_type:complete